MQAGGKSRAEREGNQRVEGYPSDALTRRDATAYLRTRCVDASRRVEYELPERSVHILKVIPGTAHMAVVRGTESRFAKQLDVELARKLQKLEGEGNRRPTRKKLR